jgi:hypothetical protein
MSYYTTSSFEMPPRGRNRKVTQPSTVHISDQGEEFNFEAISDTSDHGSGQGMIFHSYSLYYLTDNLQAHLRLLVAVLLAPAHPIRKLRL